MCRGRAEAGPQILPRNLPLHLEESMVAFEVPNKAAVEACSLADPVANKAAVEAHVG